MPEFTTAAEALKYAEGIHVDKVRIRDFRKVRDRRMDDELAAFSLGLSPKLKEHWFPFQSPEPDHEIQTIKHLMASNSSEVEVITTSNDSALGKQPQALEDALVALDEGLWPIQTALDECDGILGDGLAGAVLERVPGSPNLAEYADAQGFQQDAETAYDAGSIDEESDDPQSQYNRAYADARKSDNGLDPHEVAYGRVTDNARMQDGLRWRVRIVDMITADVWLDGQGVDCAAFVERGQMELNPCIKAFGDYGVTIDGDRWVVTDKGKKTNIDAVGVNIIPRPDDTTSSTLRSQDRMVNYTQIKSRGNTVIVLEHLSGGTPDDPGQMITIPNAFGGKSSGCYIIAGNTKLRGNPTDRYDPPVLAILVMSQILNMVVSAILSMAYVEATRDEYQLDNPSPIPPADATQETKSIQAKDGAAPPVAAGEVKRIPSTEIAMEKVYEILDQMLDRFRSRELLAGTGSSSETGVHLARLQTQLLTQLVPFQTARATVRKQILQDFMLMVASTQEDVVIPWLPKDTKTEGKVAKPRTLTPKMARLPVVLRYTLGADTPESKAAREQLSQQRTEFGATSMTTHQEAAGVKDIDKENRLIAVDAVRARMVGTIQQPGFLVTTVADMLKAYVERGLQLRLGEMPPAPPAPMAPGIPADGGGTSPVQVMPGGVPVAPGASAIPA